MTKYKHEWRGRGWGGIIDLSSAQHDRGAQKDGQVERWV